MLPSLLSSVTSKTLPVLLAASMIASLSSGYTVRRSSICAEMPSAARRSAACNAKWTAKPYVMTVTSSPPA